MCPNGGPIGDRLRRLTCPRYDQNADRMTANHSHFPKSPMLASSAMLLFRDTNKCSQSGAREPRSSNASRNRAVSQLNTISASTTLSDARNYVVPCFRQELWQNGLRPIRRQMFIKICREQSKKMSGRILAFENAVSAIWI